MPDVDKNNDGHLDVIVEDTKLELESNDRDDKTKLNDENDRVKTNGKVKNVNDDDNALEKVKKKITRKMITSVQKKKKLKQKKISDYESS